ncbi:MAG: D-hexose-6-phosphate mutarotase [Methyloligellaceae bacterium]
MLPEAATPHRPDKRKRNNRLKIYDIENREAAARIAEQGAQLLQWKPHGQDDVIWLSPGASFSPGKPIRGGIPICWPWFGMHPTTSEYPSHGLARRNPWKLQTNEDLGDRTLIEFEFINNDFESWPYYCSATLKFHIGQTLDIQLTTKNLSQTCQLAYTQALHTYFKVGDIRELEVRGLENTQYINKLKRNAFGKDSTPLTIDTEIDRIYMSPADNIIIDDYSMKRKINISHKGANAIVVWNPGKKKAETMGDMGFADSYKQMLCVETATAGKQCMILEPGEQHTISSSYSVSD